MKNAKEIIRIKENINECNMIIELLYGNKEHLREYRLKKIKSILICIVASIITYCVVYTLWDINIIFTKATSLLIAMVAIPYCIYCLLSYITSIFFPYFNEDGSTLIPIFSTGFLSYILYKGGLDLSLTVVAGIIIYYLVCIWYSNSNSEKYISELHVKIAKYERDIEEVKNKMYDL